MPICATAAQIERLLASRPVVTARGWRATWHDPEAATGQRRNEQLIVHADDGSVTYTRGTATGDLDIDCTWRVTDPARVATPEGSTVDALLDEFAPLKFGAVYGLAGAPAEMVVCEATPVWAGGAWLQHVLLRRPTATPYLLAHHDGGWHDWRAWSGAPLELLEAPGDVAVMAAAVVDLMRIDPESLEPRCRPRAVGFSYGAGARGKRHVRYADLLDAMGPEATAVLRQRKAFCLRPDAANALLLHQRYAVKGYSGYDDDADPPDSKRERDANIAAAGAMDQVAAFIRGPRGAGGLRAAFVDLAA